jgi:hypothetical protein
VQFDQYSSGWSHTASPKARKKFVAFLSQIPPRGPFLPVVPVCNYCTVNNMRFVAFLDTEEVAGSNPVVPTIFIIYIHEDRRISTLRYLTRRIRLFGVSAYRGVIRGGVIEPVVLPRGEKQRSALAEYH